MSKIDDPVLADLKLDVFGAEVTDIEPHRLPDLFAGSQVLVFGRYKGTGHGTVRLAGRIGGQERIFSYPVDFPETERENGFIPRLWASRKIGTLLEEIRLHGENAELKDEVVRLSKEFGIPTPYTSLLVEEPRQLRGPLRDFAGLALQQGISALAARKSGVIPNAPPAPPGQSAVGRANAGGLGGFGGGGIGGYSGGPGGSLPAPAPPGPYSFGGNSASTGGFQ